MELVDHIGYRAIQRHWHTICTSNIDPVDLGQRLIQQGLINHLLIEKAMAEHLTSRRVHVILDGIVRNGEIFMKVTGSDESTRWLSKALEDSYKKEAAFVVTCQPSGEASGPSTQCGLQRHRTTVAVDRLAHRCDAEAFESSNNERGEPKQGYKGLQNEGWRPPWTWGCWSLWQDQHQQGDSSADEYVDASDMLPEVLPEVTCMQECRAFIRNSNMAATISGTYWSTIGFDVVAITAGFNGIITAQFLSSKRPIAQGYYNPATCSGSVNFTDDPSRKYGYAFKFNPATGSINWDSPGNVWHTLHITGNYSSSPHDHASSTISGSPYALGSITVSLLHSNRPAAQGHFDAATLSGSVNFTDDRVYRYTFNPERGVINWDNPGNIWYRVH